MGARCCALPPTLSDCCDEQTHRIDPTGSRVATAACYQPDPLAHFAERSDGVFFLVCDGWKRYQLARAREPDPGRRARQAAISRPDDETAVASRLCVFRSHQRRTCTHTVGRLRGP